MDSISDIAGSSSAIIRKSEGSTPKRTTDTKLKKLSGFFSSKAKVNVDIDESNQAPEEPETTVKVQKKKKTRRNKVKICPHFPCCFGLPLEIAIQVLAVIDLVHCCLMTVMWSTLLGLDIFGSKKSENSNVGKPFVPPDKSPKIPPYVDPFATSTPAPPVPPWTIRTSSTEPPKYDYDAVDLDELSKSYSKIALITQERHSIVEEECGRDYIIKYLFTYQLQRTKELWEEFLELTITAEMLYIIISLLMLMSVCCFIEHRGAKFLVMILWWLEWVPYFIDVQALITSQSKRLCILEYGWTSPPFHGQSFFLIFLLLRLLLFKPYHLLVHFCYIQELLIYGYLKDESLKVNQAGGGETEHSQKFFRDFYTEEMHRAGEDVAENYAATDIANIMGFDKLDTSDVSRIQHTVMTGQPDPFSQRNEDIRAMQASGQIHHGLKSIRKT